MTATPAQKKELTANALKIAGFTENSEYPGVFTQEHGMKKIVKDLNVAGKAYFLVDKKKVTEDDEHNTLAKVDKIITEAEDGRTPTKTEPDIIVTTTMHGAEPDKPNEPIDPEIKQHIENTKSLSDDDPAKVTAEMVNTSKVLTPPKRKLPPPAEPVELTIDIVKKYINEKVTDEEAYKFIQLCKARQLNPFLGQAHLIKKEFTGTAKMVVGKEGFMERAERDPNYNGFEAGIIVTTKEKITKDLPGAFHTNDEILVGGWAKVYRTDRTYPIEARVLLKEYDTGKASWARMKATMIRKVPIVQAHREAFPSELSGMYDQSEMGVEVST